MKFSLIGINGNAYSIMGYVTTAMEECKLSEQEKSEYRKDAMSSDYNHLLRVSIKMIEKCNKIIEK